jgi:hypothetical protein
MNLGWQSFPVISPADPFFINVRASLLLIIFIYMLVVFAIIFGQKMTKEKHIFSLNTLYFFPVFGIIAPFWLLKAVFNTILARKPDWR